MQRTCRVDLDFATAGMAELAQLILQMYMLLGHMTPVTRTSEILDRSAPSQMDCHLASAQMDRSSPIFVDFQPAPSQHPCIRCVCYCDNLPMVEMSMDETSADGMGSHLVTLAQLARTLRLQLLRENGVELVILRPHRGRKSRLIKYSDVRAKEIRRREDTCATSSSDVAAPVDLLRCLTHASWCLEQLPHLERTSSCTL